MNQEWLKNPKWLSQSRYLHARKDPSFVGGFEITVEFCEGVINGIPKGYNCGDFNLLEMGGLWMGPMDLPKNN